MDLHHHQGDGPGDGDNRTIGRWVLWGFIVVAGYFLLTEHRAHLYGILPYLFLAACPLMHLFHHGGHGHGHGHGHGMRGDGGPGAMPQAPDDARTGIGQPRDTDR